MLSEPTLAYGARAMTALLGVDALYRDESGDVDGLAVLNMDSESRYAADPFGGYDDARACFVELKLAAADLPEHDRRVYYHQLAVSTLAFIEWRQRGLPFRSQLSDFLHVPAAPASDDDLNNLRNMIRSFLTKLGYSGDLAAQAAEWEHRHRVPPEDVQTVLEDLLAEAWERTEEQLQRIPAPKSDAMKVATVSDVSYNARCNYAERTIQINVDPVLTRPGLKHLAIHEGYPGHYLQFKLRETMAADGKAAPDVLISVVNSASSCVFEGIADYGIRMIGWGATDDDMLQGLMNQYRAGIGTGAAWRLHELGWEESKVTDWLRGQSLVGGEGWVVNRMRFIAAPSRAALIWSYWFGERAIAPACVDVSEADRPAFIEFLYGRMHSPQSVGMFDGRKPVPRDEGDRIN